jgi:hypothetical protein
MLPADIKGLKTFRKRLQALERELEAELPVAVTSVVSDPKSATKA